MSFSENETCRSSAGVLAGIAQALSSTRRWEASIANALRQLHDAFLPDGVLALVVLAGEWRSFSCPESDDADELEVVLMQHYSALSGKCGSDTALLLEDGGTPGSSVSVPVTCADRVIGVLHARSDQNEAYSSHDLSVLAVAAALVGSYVGNVQALAGKERCQVDLLLAQARAERRLAVLEAVAANTKAHLAYLDRDMNLVWANTAYAEGSGYTREEVLGRNHFELFPNEENQAIFKQVRDTGEPYVAREKPFRHPGQPERGTTYWNWTLSAVRDSNGAVDSLVLSLIDVTEDVEARRELEEAYKRERHIANILQRSMMPEIDQDLDRHEIAADYRPAFREADVGGDFYDVFSLGRNRRALVVGDVSGKGLNAAVYTTMARYMVRAYAHEDWRPRSVMQRLNQTLCEYMPEDMFVTMFYGVLDLSGNTLTYASGGHEPPVIHNPILTGSGPQSALLELSGPAVGMVPESSYSQEALNLVPGDILTIYTDGITEARSGGEFFGTDGILGVVVSSAEDGALSLLAGIFEAALNHAGGQFHDDAAVLVVKAKQRSLAG